MTEPGSRRWPAPAKLNLFLHVTGRRADGYHELQTLFQLLDWGDELFIEPREDGRVSRPGRGYAVAEDDDLAVRAGRLLQAETGCRFGAEIRMRKAVPMGSGMGGGSSDAATVLLVLNEQWGCGLSLAELAVLGARLGADVPVFVHGRTAMATGVGEELSPVELDERHYVLVFPGISIPTPEVFGDASLRRDSIPLTLQDVLAGRGRNDCEAVVRNRFEAMEKAFSELEPWGRFRMTGTGSGLFLEAASRSCAEATAREIKSLYNSRAVRGVDRSPLHEKLYTDGD